MFPHASWIFVTFYYILIHFEINLYRSYVFHFLSSFSLSFQLFFRSSIFFLNYFILHLFTEELSLRIIVTRKISSWIYTSDSRLIKKLSCVDRRFASRKNFQNNSFNRARKNHNCIIVRNSVLSRKMKLRNVNVETIEVFKVQRCYKV